MAFKNFVSPHVHIRSFDSIGKPEDFAKIEEQLNTGYLVVTDHGSLEACRQVYDLCGKDGKFAGKLRPVLGIEAYMRSDDCPIFQEQGIERTRLSAKDPESPLGYKDHIKYMHVTLHAQDEAAFYELTKRLSRADSRAERHGKERKALFDWQDIEALGAMNVTGTSGCLIGMVGRHLLKNNDPVAATKYYEKLRSCFKPGNFYVEIMPHKCDRDWKSCVQIHYEDGTKVDVPLFKNLKTPAGTIKAEDLAQEFSRDPQNVWKKHTSIIEVMNNRKWEPLNSPKIKSVFLESGFIENECRPWSPTSDLQLALNKFVMDLAEKHGDTVLVSDDAHFPTPDYKDAQDIVLGRMGGSWKFANSHHRRSSQEAWEYFSKNMGMSEKSFERLVENTHEWASKFHDFKFTPRQTLPTNFYPKDTLAHTMKLIQQKNRMRWDDPRYTARLKQEIELFHMNGKIDLLTYFFIDEEVCSAYARNGLLTGPGRGSAGGVLLSYLLGITHVDPIKWDLSLDRFLTPDRIKSKKMPDIDQDLEDLNFLSGEDRNSGWLKERFGDCTIQIGTYVCMHLSNAIRDTFRAKEGFVAPEIEEFCKKLPKPPQGVNDDDFLYGYESADGNIELGLMETSTDLQRFAAKYPEHWKCVEMLIGNARDRGRHPCGRIIANEPVSNFLPIAEIKDVKATQYDAAGVEAMGALKMDFLGLSNLKFISDTVKLIQNRHGAGVDWSISRFKDADVGTDRTAPQITTESGLAEMVRVVPLNGKLYDIYDLPDDSKIVAKLVSGDTKGVFQLDTEGARKWLKVFDFDVKKDGDVAKGLSTKEDLAIFTALDRPGPLDAEIVHADGTKNNMLVEYARRVKGIRDENELPILYELLPNTHGIIVFQEQLTKIYQFCTDSSGVEAEQFRGFAAKKKKQKMQEIYPSFMERASIKVGKETAQTLWDRMITFASYGFNRSHSVSYATLAYTCAWLKHHYPLEWWASVLSNVDRDKVDEKFWREVSSFILLPDLSKSGDRFVIEGNKLRAPLSMLNGLGESAFAQLNELAPYKDIDELMAKLEKYKVDNGTWVTTTKDGVTEKKFKKGRSPVGPSLVAKMVVAGVCDTLFPTTDEFGLPLTTEEKLLLFAKAEAKALGVKKINNYASKFSLGNKVARYLDRRAILTAYTQPLIPLVMDSIPNKIKKAGDKHTILRGKEEVLLIDGPNVELMESIPMGPVGGVPYAVLGYVIDDNRSTYTDKKTKKEKNRAALILDLDGYRKEQMIWPDDEGNLPKVFDNAIDGDLVVCYFYKAQSGKTYLNEIEVLAESTKRKVNTDESKQ